LEIEIHLGKIYLRVHKKTCKLNFGWFLQERRKEKDKFPFIELNGANEEAAPAQ